MGSINNNTHSGLVKAISQIPNATDVKDLFENPNKHSEVVSHISFHYPYPGADYAIAGIVVAYNRQELFIAHKGYWDFKNIEDIIQIIKKELNL